MIDYLADPLSIALFVAIVFPVILFGSLFSVKKNLSDRLLNKDQLNKFDHAKSSDTSFSADVRKELPNSKFGFLGHALDAYISKNENFNLKILQSGIKQSLGDIFLILLIVLVLIFISTRFFFEFSIIISMIISIGSTIILPYFYLKIRTKKRQKNFLSDFPDALDLVVRGIRSGLPVTEAIETIGKEFSGPTGEMFENIQAKIAIGQTLEEALWITASQMPLPEFRFFIISLTIQQETGGNLGEILQKLSAIIRKRQQLRLKIKAMSSEARASAMIIGSLPFLMMIMLHFVSPDYVAKLFLDPRGNMMLGAGAVMLSMGIGLMVKLSKFEI